MSLANALWLAGYLVLMAALSAVLFSVRAGVLEELSTPEAKAEWEAWRQKAREQSGENKQPVEGPVQRRVPKSAEPPALVLMRDYFGICLAASLFFTSLLFGVTMIVVRGMIEGEPEPAVSQPDALARE